MCSGVNTRRLLSDRAVSIDDVGDKRRDVRDQQQGKGGKKRERRNQPDQNERRQERADDDRIPTQVVQFQLLTIGADPVAALTQSRNTLQQARILIQLR